MSDMFFGFLACLGALLLFLMLVAFWRLASTQIDRLIDPTNTGAAEGDTQHFRVRHGSDDLN